MRGWTTTSLILVSLWLAPRQVFAAWPPTAGNTYTVQPTEAVMSIPAMVLPAGFVLNFDPSIQRVQERRQPTVREGRSHRSIARSADPAGPATTGSETG